MLQNIYNRILPIWFAFSPSATAQMSQCCLMRDGVLFVNCSIFFVPAAAISLTEEYLNINIKHLFICWISVAKTITLNILAHVDQLLQSMINFLVELIWIVPIPCRENVKYFFKYHHKKKCSMFGTWQGFSKNQIKINRVVCSWHIFTIFAVGKKWQLR